MSRSKSIGVRGDNTYRYLTESIGYENSQVDIVYKPSGPNDIENITGFLRKNKCPLQIFEGMFFSFQSDPRVFYERPVTFERSIKIPRPYVTCSGASARLSADIQIDGKVTTLWCETNSAYQDFLLFERADAFLCALLPLAMRSGKDIVCEAPVTEQFLHNLNEILIPHLCVHDPRLYRTRVMASGDASALISGGGVATGMSCGVDSFYTTSLYLDSDFKSMNLTHLYIGNYLYGNKGLIYERAELVAAELGLPLVQTSTNISEALKLPHVYTHFFKTMFGVLSLRKLFRIYYYSSAEDFSHFNLSANGTRDTAQFELLLLYTFSCSDFQVVTGGAKSERLEKTAAIRALPVARKFLNVCLYPARTRNCGECAKCRRTLLMLDMLNSLEYFCDVFDINAYRSTRLDSFVYLVQQKNSVMLSEVYKYFLRVEPSLVKQAEERLSRGNAKPGLPQPNQ